MVRTAQAINQPPGPINLQIPLTHWQACRRISRLEVTLAMQPTLIHHHLLIRAEVGSPPLRDFDLRKALRALVKRIRM